MRNLASSVVAVGGRSPTPMEKLERLGKDSGRALEGLGTETA
jgi:hypothetical protein